MSRIIVSCILCVVAYCSQAADILQVSGGAEITVNGGVFSVGGTNYDNTRSYVLDFAGNSTIAVKSGLVGFGIIATNGTVTLDLTEIGNAEFALDNGAVVDGNGLLVVKGRDSLCVGSRTITENNFAPPAGVVNVEYRNSDDVEYENPEGLILVGRVLEWELPATSHWKLDNSATPCIAHNDSDILRLMMKDGVVTLKNRTMWIYRSDVFPAANTPVSVEADSELVVILRTIKPEEYFAQLGPSGDSQRMLTNPINVSEGGVLNLRSHDLTASGAITGNGTLRYTETANNYSTKVTDASGFSGLISCERSTTTLRFGNASFGGNVSMALCDGCSVEIGCDAEDGYVTAIGELAGPETGSASLSFPNEKTGTFSIVSKTGNVTITGGGFRQTSWTGHSIDIGGTFVSDVNGDEYRMALADDYASRSDVFVLTRTNGRNVYLRSLSAESVDFRGFDVPGSCEYNLVARDGVTYVNVPENVHVIVPEGVSASVSFSYIGKSNIRMEGGTLTVAEPDWRSKVKFWMDPSDKDSMAFTNIVRTLSGVTYPVVWWLNDTRDSQTETKLVAHKEVASTLPTLITNGVNGLSYLSCDLDGARRLWFGDNNGISVKYAIMVFGSQLGGGQGIIGNIGGYYARGGELSTSITKDNPIFASNITTYVNGMLVDARERCLNGGWEIISFDASQSVVHGFGFNKGLGTPTNCRGQNYGEVLLFSETPTAEERIAAEKYLAEKWGLLKYYKDLSEVPELRIDGTGSIVVDDDFAISGSFAGTMDLNGKSLLIADEPMPPGEEAVERTGMLAWFDPELSDMVEGNNGKVTYLYDRRGKNEGAPVLNGNGRTPLLVNSARGFGPLRNWIDYSPANFYDEMKPDGTERGNYGRLMRLNKYPNLDSKIAVPFDDARTVFVVQDSVKGGGTPFLSEVNGGGDIVPRLTLWSDMPPNPGTPVWRGNTAEIFTEGTKGGATYLDGRAIDGAVEGFQGRPELLTAVGNRDFTLGVFAYYKYLDLLENIRVDAGEILGEIIVYDSVLGDDVRKQIEAYLMWKWLGVARDGYSVATNMTLTGSGSVTVASKSQMPKFDAEFTGAAAFEENAFDFTVNGDGTVSGAIDMGNATVSFPATCTANVAFADGMKTGTYTLVQGGSIASETSWTLNLRNGGSRIATIVQNDGTVVLEVRGLGTVVTVR